MVDAYETEVKAALYPRVILDKTIVDIGKKDDQLQQLLYGKEYNISELRLNKDTDEKFYIDYFLPARYHMNNEEFVMEYIPALRKIILSGQNFSKPDLKVKYGWLKNKYNTMIEFIKDKSNHEQLKISKSIIKKQVAKLNTLK